MLNNLEEGIEMVPLALNGIGSATKSPDVMVLLLSPIDLEHYKLPNGNKMFYPVAIPSEMSPIIFSKINSLYSNDVQLPELTHYFELITDTKLTALHIYHGRYAIKSCLFYAGKDGTRGSFRTSMVRGLLTALEHKLDIFIEYKLLKEAARYFDASQEEVPYSSPSIHTVQSYYNELKSKISTGVKPDNPQVLHLVKMLTSMNNELIDSLLNEAIASENYEWVSVLKSN